MLRYLAAMPNPFVVGPPVRGPDLCGRDVELERIGAALRGGALVAVAGERGSGLTSLALELAHRLGRPSLPAVRLEMSEAEDGEAAGALLRRGLGTSPGRPEAPPIHLFLDGLRREAAVAAGASLLERTAGDRAGTLLLGSASGVAELLEVAAGGEGGRPTLSVVLDAPPPAAWLPYVLERFLATDRWIGNEHVEEVLEVTGGVARPTQAVLHALWDGTEEGGGVEGDAAVEDAIRQAVDRDGAGHRRLLDGLTANQRRVLRGLARRPQTGPYSAEFVEELGLASASSVQRALQALETQRLVVRGGEDSGGGPRPADPFLARWLRRQAEEAVDAVGPEAP